MKRISLVWFKTDLRLHDNESLVKAIRESDLIIPVYCIDDSHFIKTKFGFNKTGSFRAQFLIESLKNLDSQLREIDSGLIIVKGKPEIEIPKLIKQFGVQKVFSKKEIAYEELKTELLVEIELLKSNCSLETSDTSCLFSDSDLPFSISMLPDFFTDFRKQVEKTSTVRARFKKPDSIMSPQISETIFPELMELGLQKLGMDERSALKFKGGETAGLSRLHSYFLKTKSIFTYKETRNGLIGESYSTKFSPWLALGCLSPVEIYHQLKKIELEFTSNESTYWLIFELLWRDYFRYAMEKYGSKFFHKNGIKINRKNNYLNVDQNILIAKWINGETKNEFIDANMLELKLTGFMSNRGRQNVASYLCNDLQIDWRYGAAYFEQQLIDYDVSSNWCNWAYIAGVGNDPRENRYFNTTKQANQYDPDYLFRNLWLKKN